MKHFFFIFFTIISFSQQATHKVMKGETLFSISKKYKITVSQLENLNPKSKAGLNVNDVILLSNIVENVKTKISEHKVQPKETLFRLAKKYNLTIEKLIELNPSLAKKELKIGTIIKVSSDNKIFESNSNQEQPKTIFHTVQPKETKFGLSKKYNISISELENLNPQIKSEFRIGTRLQIKTFEIVKTIIENPIILQPTSTLLQIDLLISNATKNIGVKYKSGGEDTSGFDCSGLIFASFQSINKVLPRTSNEQANIGITIDRVNAQKGDLIFFTTNNSSVINHVGLITEVSNNDIKFIHASTSSGVIISSLSEDYYYKCFAKINRVFE